MTTAELRDLLAGASSYVDTIAVGPDRHLVLPPGTPNGKGNHSCDPNLWWSDPYTLVARRDIGADEELTNDYATSTRSPEFVMACGCGSAECRGTVTGDDWRRPDLRRRYGGHWSCSGLAADEPVGGRLGRGGWLVGIILGPPVRDRHDAGFEDLQPVGES